MEFLRRFAVIVPCLLFLVFELGCGDEYRPIANPIVSPGGQPQATHYVYVVNYNPIGDGSSTKIDVSGDTNLQVLATGIGSIYEGYQGSALGSIFVANRDGDSVSQFTIVGTPTVINIALYPGSRPVSLASTTSSEVYVVNSGNNVVCPKTGSLSVISTTSLVATSTVCVGTNPGAIVQLPAATLASGAALNQKVYVANQADTSISVYNPITLAISSTITAANGLNLNPVALVSSLDGSYVFVVTQGNGSTPGALDIISTTSDTIVASVALGNSPTSAYLDPILNRLYVANTGGNTVTVFDATNVTPGVNPAIQTLATVNVGTAPVSVAALPNGLSFYVANSGSNNVTVVSSGSFDVIATVPVGQDPIWIATEPSSTKVYTANEASGNISIIQTSNNTVVLNLPAPQQDPSCDASVSTCPLQRPQMILTQ